MEAFVEAEGLSWDDPWLQSIDLEYHNIDPLSGLFFGCHTWQANCGVEQQCPAFQARRMFRRRIHGRQVVLVQWLFFSDCKFALCHQLGFDRLR